VAKLQLVPYPAEVEKVDRVVGKRIRKAGNTSQPGGIQGSNQGLVVGKG